MANATAAAMASGEIAAARSFLSSAPRQEDAWTELCHALMNTKEFTHLD